MRWIKGLLPLAAVAFLAAGPAAHPALLRPVDPRGKPPPCSGVEPPGGAGPAWYRLDALLDDHGSLDARRLHVGMVGGPERQLDLPPESFATGPRDSLILVGSDDGETSRVSLLDVARGCDTHVADEAAVVRSALLAPDGTAIVEHRLDRATRADLGVWRRPLDGGRARRIVAGVPFDRRYGRTFTTELHWAPDGRLAVTSCGELACRTRLVEMASGRTSTVGPTGPVIGVGEDGGVVAYHACPGYPCAILRFGERGGMRMLVPEAGRASLAGRRLVFEAGPAGLAVLDLATGRMQAVAGGDGLVPLPDGSGATAGAEHEPDAVLAAPGGDLLGANGSVVPAGGALVVPVTGAQR